MTLNNDNHPIIYFDGACNLCNRTIQFIIKQDKKKLFFFSSLQSVSGENALQNLSIKGNPAPDSIILFYRGCYFVKSDAALHIFSMLGGGWKLLYVFAAIPLFIRNRVYDIIARNRYKWFGRREECMVPAPELLSRFLN